MLPPCYHRTMGRAAMAVFFMLIAPSAIFAADKVDPLTEARQLYNQRQFAAALSAAERARLTPALADRADLIAARAYLERFRESAASDDLTNARERLRRIDPRRFDAIERTEFIVGLGQALYFDESHGAAADVFETVLDNGNALPADSRTGYWTGGRFPSIVRRGCARARAGKRLSTDPRPHARRADDAARELDGGVLAGVGRPLAGRSSAAWDAVEAGGCARSLATDRGEALRADLDRLMVVAIIPERARMLAQPADTLKLDWEKFKLRWN